MYSSVTDTGGHITLCQCIFVTLPNSFNLYWPFSLLKGCVSQPSHPGDQVLVTTLFAKKQKVQHVLVLELIEVCELLLCSLVLSGGSNDPVSEASGDPF